MAVLTRSRRGLATVEAAITLPVILLLTMGLFEYGWLLLKYQQITNAARQGARALALPNGATDYEAAIDHAMSKAGMGDVDYQVTTALDAIPSLQFGYMATITLRVEYDQIGLGMPLVPTPQALEASVTVLREPM